MKGGVYHALVHTVDDFFTAGPSVTYPLVFPLTVKVTASSGKRVGGERGGKEEERQGGGERE